MNSTKYDSAYQKERFETTISIGELMEKYFDIQTTGDRCRKCPGYRQTWSCPEFDFDPAAFWKGFSSFRFIVDRISNRDLTSPEAAQDRLFAEKTRFDTEMRDIGKTIPGSYALAAQECVACKKCARLSGLPCVHPEIMRYGPEAIGVLVAKMTEDKFGFALQWSDGVSVPDYYILAAGVIMP